MDYLNEEGSEVGNAVRPESILPQQSSNHARNVSTEDDARIVRPERNTFTSNTMFGASSSNVQFQ